MRSWNLPDSQVNSVYYLFSVKTEGKKKETNIKNIWGSLGTYESELVSLARMRVCKPHQIILLK